VLEVEAKGRRIVVVSVRFLRDVLPVFLSFVAPRSTPERLRCGPERKKFRPHSQGEIAVNISETRTALLRCCLAFLLVYFLASPSVSPQGNQGTIEGIVVDQSGAAVPGAKLTSTNDATGIHFQTTTDSNGLFTFPVLPVGTYTCLLYTSPSPRDLSTSRMPSSA